MAYDYNNNANSNGGYPQQQYPQQGYNNYSRKRTYASNSNYGKSDAYEQQKSARIDAYEDKKQKGIALTSSINNAVLWVTSHPDWSKEMTDDERKSFLDKTVRMFLGIFTTGIDQLYGEIYDKLMSSVPSKQIKKHEELEISND